MSRTTFLLRLGAAAVVLSIAIASAFSALKGGWALRTSAPAVALIVLALSLIAALLAPRGSQTRTVSVLVAALSAIVLLVFRFFIN